MDSPRAAEGGIDGATQLACRGTEVAVVAGHRTGPDTMGSHMANTAEGGIGLDSGANGSHTGGRTFEVGEVTGGGLKTDSVTSGAVRWEGGG